MSGPIWSLKRQGHVTKTQSKTNPREPLAYECPEDRRVKPCPGNVRNGEFERGDGKYEAS